MWFWLGSLQSLNVRCTLSLGGFRTGFRTFYHDLSLFWSVLGWKSVRSPRHRLVWGLQTSSTTLYLQSAYMGAWETKRMGTSLSGGRDQFTVKCHSQILNKFKWYNSRPPFWEKKSRCLLWRATVTTEDLFFLQMGLSGSDLGCSGQVVASKGWFSKWALNVP